jgi:hypothetical protein
VMVEGACGQGQGTDRARDRSNPRVRWLHRSSRARRPRAGDRG